VSEPFLGEIKIMSFNFPPKGWALCNGQLLPINQNQALYSLLGTTYGGDGRVNFGLPNLQGRTPNHMGNGFSVGQMGGEQAHVLTISEMPTHVHSAMASSIASDTFVPTSNYLGMANNFYAPLGNPTSTPLPSATLAITGGSQPHENMQPYLVLSFCIALQGIFPAQN
jgi:microcystin-dependent protein